MLESNATGTIPVPGGNVVWRRFGNNDGTPLLTPAFLAVAWG